MSQLVEKDNSLPQTNVATPGNLLEIAVSKGADVDQLEKLMALQERYEAKQAKSSFLEAVTSFQSEVPRITKTKNGHNYKYAPLADIVEQIKTTLKHCGLSYRFEQNHNNGIEVTCILSHVDGHSEKTTMQAEADKSGSKNSVQAIGSTVQYLQRYTLVGALGLTTADEDIDARLPYERITGEQVEAIRVTLADLEVELNGLTNGFNKWLSKPPLKCSSIEEIAASNFQSVMEKIQSSANARRQHAN